MPPLSLTLLPGRYSVCRLSPDAAFPDWALRGPFTSITRTPEELSLVCPEEDVPADVRREPGWRCLRVAGTLDFSLVGVLAGLTGTLARAGAPAFALSTFDTDYLLVKEADLPRALDALRQGGYAVDEESHPVDRPPARP